MSDTIFPEIAIMRGAIGFIYQTTLRVKHTDGFYYLWRFCKTGDRDPNDIFLKEMLREVYFVMQFGIVNPDLKDQVFDTPIYPLDADQRCEADRLKHQYQPLFKDNA